MLMPLGLGAIECDRMSASARDGLGAKVRFGGTLLRVACCARFTAMNAIGVSRPNILLAE